MLAQNGQTDGQTYEYICFSSTGSEEGSKEMEIKCAAKTNKITI
jgi:hypothetical protein